MCPQYLMDKRSTQSRDGRGFQRSLHFSCKSLGFMFSLLENMKLTWRQDPLHGQLGTHCCYAMGSLRRRSVGSVDDGLLSTTIDQGFFVKTRMRQNII